MRLMTSGAAILAVAMTLSPLQANAQGRQGRGMMGWGRPDSLRGPGIEMILRQREDLELTDDQVRQLDQIRAEAVQRRTAHQSQMAELRSRMLAGDMEVEELREVAESRREASVEVARQQRERVDAILNDAQRQKLDAWRDQARAYRMGRMSGMRSGMRSGRAQRGMMRARGLHRDSREMYGRPGFAPGMRNRWAPMAPGFRRGPGGFDGFDGVGSSYRPTFGPDFVPDFDPGFGPDFDPPADSGLPAETPPTGGASL
jgi:hypothetical protein